MLENEHIHNINSDANPSHEMRHPNQAVQGDILF